MAGQQIYTFGGFTLEVTERRLSRGGEPIALAPKAFDVLVALVERAGRRVGKTEILDTVWRGSFVEEGILTVHISALRKALHDTSRTPAFIETVARSGYRFIAPVTEKPAAARVIPGRWSIAVLPARPAGAGTDGDRLIGLAITDVLIDRLGRFDPVVVRPADAVHGRTDAEDPAAAGRMLQTDAVLDSCFERTSGGIRLSAQLIPSEVGGPLWDGAFDDSSGEAAADAVADAVAARLGATLHSPDRLHRARVLSPVPARLAVYELCGRGRAHLLSASRSEVPQALEAFRAAASIDPAYAPAHANLALAYCAQAAMRLAPPADAYREARAAALRALAVDDRSADAQVALGSVLFLAEWDWSAADRCLRRAVEINPSHVQGLLMYGRLLDALGRWQDALDMKLKAFEADPLSGLVHVQIALCHWNHRHYDDAILWARKALALDRQHLLAREFLASAYLQKGDFDRYLEELIEHGAAAGAARAELEPLVTAYTTGGRSGFWRHSLDRMSRSPGVPALQFAVFHAMAGDPDAAFQHLDRAILEHDPSLVDLAVAPQWDNLRSDPRYAACVARMGLPAGAR